MTNLDLQTEQGMSVQESKPKRKFWLWGCTAGFTLVCLLIGGVVGNVYFAANKPPFQLDGTISILPEAKQGDEFDIVFTLANSTTESVFIKHIVFFRILDSPFLLDGTSVISIEPEMKSEPLNVRDVKYSYFREIKSGETQTVTFHMRAESAGIYYENIGVYAKDPFHPDPAFIQVFHLTGVEIKITP